MFRTRKQDVNDETNRKKLPGWIILPILACVVLIFFIVSRLSAGEGTEQLTVVTVERGDIRQTYLASGTVESQRTKVFYSPVNAPVNQCTAKVGSAVKKGDLLVAFDVTNLERDNQQSELNVLGRNIPIKTPQSRAEGRHRLPPRGKRRRKIL